jgi:hypothetical protein
VTLDPEQIVLFASLEAIVTLEGRLGFTVAVTAVRVEETQPVVVFLDSE